MDKVLIISQYFWPENFKINELSEELSKSFNVDVLTSIPNYPTGIEFTNYKRNKAKFLYYKKVKIYRIPQVTRGNGSRLRIVLNYLSFFLFSFINSPRFFFKGYKYVFVFAPSPVLIGYIGILISKFNGARSIIWILDLWPQILKELNIISSNRIISFFNLILSKMYNLFDILLVQSDSFKKEIKKRLINKNKIFYIPSWPDLFKVKKNITNKKNKTFKILFTGNLGYAQNLDISIFATKQLIKRKIKNFEWTFVGDGRYKKIFVKKVKDNNLEKYFKFYKSTDTKRLKKFFTKTNVCFLSLNKGKILNFTIPAKLQTYMSTGIPILSSASGETELIIKKAKCGLNSIPSKPDQLVKNIIKLMSLKEKKLQILGINGSLYVKKYFNKRLIINSMKSLMTNDKIF